MKKEFLLLFALCNVLVFQLSAQGDFAPLGAKWHYSYFNNHYTFEGYIYQEAVKDTAINGQACRKLERARIGTLWNNPSDIDTVVMPAIYLYSNPDTVFYYNDSFEQFFPLYIFNVEAGDTMTYREAFFDYDSDTLFQVLVTDVTYEYIDGDTLRVIHTEGLGEAGWGFDGNRNVYYMEKTGALGADLLCHGRGPHMGSYYPSIVRCYQEDDGTAYIWDECTRIGDEGNSVQDVGNLRDALKVYPNPLNTEGLLFIDNPTGKPIQVISVFDVIGRKKQYFGFEKQAGESYTLNLNSFSPGLYFLQIEFKDQSPVNYKIIKN